MFDLLFNISPQVTPNLGFDFSSYIICFGGTRFWCVCVEFTRSSGLEEGNSKELMGLVQTVEHVVYFDGIRDVNRVIKLCSLY